MGAVRKPNLYLPDLSNVYDSTCTRVDEAKEIPPTPGQYAEKIRVWYIVAGARPVDKIDYDKRIRLNLSTEGYDEEYINEVIYVLNNN